MILNHIVRLLRMWQRYERTVRELSVLSERQLAELGMTRNDIVTKAWREAEAA